MKPFRHTWFCLCLLAVSLLSLPGCATRPDDSRSSIDFSGDLSMPLQVNVDNFVRRQPPAIYVAPLTSPGHRPRALFVPLRMVQQMNEPTAFADQVSRQVWNIWLSLGAFQQLEYEPKAGPYHPQRAIALARQRGAELVVGGYINHYIDGGDGGESTVTLQIEVYDVKTGLQLWSMAQSGLMEARQSHDFYLFKLRERNPADPTGFIVRSLAWDMGREIVFWVNPAARKRSESKQKFNTGGSAF